MSTNGTDEIDFLRARVRELEEENERLGTDLDSAHQHVCKLESAEARIAELERVVGEGKKSERRIQN